MENKQNTTFNLKSIHYLFNIVNSFSMILLLIINLFLILYQAITFEGLFRFELYTFNLIKIIISIMGLWIKPIRQTAIFYCLSIYFVAESILAFIAIF